MAQNLIKAFSVVRSNVFNNIRRTLSIRCFQTLKNPSHRCFPSTRHLRFNIGPALINLSRRQVQTSVIETNTNVVNNVILWKYDSTNYFRNMNIFSVVQLVFLSVTGIFMYTVLPPKKPTETWSEYALRTSIVLIMIVMPIITGLMASGLIWLLVSRSLKYIILNKGGKSVTFVCYHPTQRTRQMVVPVNDVVVKKNRKEFNQYMALKVKNSSFFFLIDRDGEFVNPLLFDYTIGAKKPKQ